MNGINVGIFVSSGLQLEDLLNFVYRLTILKTVPRVFYQVLHVYLTVHQIYLQLFEPLLSNQLDAFILF